ncbi:hypothetical protein [Nitrogeniibacter aestuarii]|uniref:hypothetical protein n=1 Tax=Nitrogeniibacter aestuarii TaxID=2815343 RepID=UPI001E374D2E|nr:hypothetical protein [Nitrogeniibacter aestuarii]
MPDQILRAAHPHPALRSRYLQRPIHLMVFLALLCLNMLATNNAYAEDVAAEFVKDVSCANSWENSFWDPGTRSCWECPKSAPKRTIWPVDREWACEQPAHEVFKHAKGPENPTPLLGFINTNCREGWFLDVGGCYSCEGYNRTLGYKITDPRACSKLVPLVKARAIERGSPGGCPEGSFQHLFPSKCYSCPAGSYRNANTGTDPTTFGACTKCGGLNGTPCPLTTLRKSCDGDLVEDFLKHRCVKSETRQRQEIAAKKLAEIANFVASKVSFANSVAKNPQVRNALSTDKPETAAKAVNTAAAGNTTMPDGNVLRTMTVGATVGAKVIYGGSAGVGAAIDLTARLPVYAYATVDHDASLGFGAAGGADIGFWVCQANKIGGNAWGVEFGPNDILAFARGLKGVEGARLSDMVKPGWDVGVTLWFGNDNVFQGFTLTPSVGAGADLGGVVWATTSVQDDPDVACDGTPRHAR